jgi:hypothetical protein
MQRHSFAIKLGLFLVFLKLRFSEYKYSSGRKYVNNAIIEITAPAPMTMPDRKLRLFMLYVNND